MTDIITWLSFALQLMSMGWPFWGQVREQRIEKGEIEINLPGIRYHKSWVRSRDTQR